MNLISSLISVISLSGDWSHLGCCHGNGDVNVVSIDDLVSLNDGVQNGLVLQGVGGSLDERRHEAKLEPVLLCERLQVGFAELHQPTANEAKRSTCDLRDDCVKAGLCSYVSGSRQGKQTQ